MALHAFCLTRVDEPALRPAVARWMKGEGSIDDQTIAAFVFTGDPHLRSVELAPQTEHAGHTDKA